MKENLPATTQPLDEVLKNLSLTNGDLVKASTEQLTFKQVQKARKGRTITPNVKGKIARALNAVMNEEKYTVKDLFRC